MKKLNSQWVERLLGKTAEEVLPGSVSNCFNSTINAYSQEINLAHTGPEEMLFWLATNCDQVLSSDAELFVIWSSSDVSVSPNHVDVLELSKKPAGYPFGLVIEHSGALLSESKVFQKADPGPQSRFEIVNLEEAFRPYTELPWMRVTHHCLKRDGSTARKDAAIE